MQKILLIAGTFLLSILCSNCSHTLNPEGTFQKKNIQADADLNDWDLPLRFGNKAGTIQYSITNDKENIYIALLCKDEATEQKILRMGMTVYFDPSGGDNKNISINFPLKSPAYTKPDDAKERTPDGGNTNNRSRKEEMLLQSSTYTITGFLHLENRSYDLNDKHFIQLAMKINDDNNLVYEAAIPIKNILGYPLKVNDNMKNFSVGIVIKGFQHAGGPGSNSVAGSGGGYRGMGGRGGGARGGMGGARSMGGGGSRNMNSASSPDRAALLKDDVNWYKFRLAVK